MAATESAGHIRKRQYQPSINSFFHRHANATDSTQSSRPLSPLSPPLPAETQASLLNVGMRVRKSVPEGYKTHKTIGMQGYPFPSTAPSASTTRFQRSHNTGGTRELTPFCGLHKTGGWATQQSPSSSAPAAMQTDEDDLPGLIISQSTTSSSYNSFTSLGSKASRSSRKRTYEEEIEEDLDAYFDDVEAEESIGASVSPASRPVAPMRLPLRKAVSVGVVRVVGEHDFDEASFLVPAEGMDLDEF